MRRYFAAVVLIILCIYSCASFAEEDEKEYAKAALNGLKVNHFAEHISAPFQGYLNFDYGQNKTQSIVDFKPVVPFRITPDIDLIIRTIAPLYERTPTRNMANRLDGSYINGWGDINPTFFITPATFDSFVVGLGPTVSIPSSTNNQYIGTGKWSLGPELAVYLITKNWEGGILTNNIWSIAGDSQRPAVNAFQLQYLVSYVFDTGWYISTNPTISANWKSPANQQWTVPFGIGTGRVIKWGQQRINLGLYGYYNAIRPAGLGPNGQLECQIEWLFKPATIHSYANE